MVEDNQIKAEVTLIGKIKDIKYNEDSALLCLEVKHQFKNKNGEYDSDLFTIETWMGSIESVKECCEIDKTILVSGRLKKSIDGTVEILGEKITLIEGGKINGIF